MIKRNHMVLVVACLAMTAAFTGGASASSAKSETAGQYVDDSVITTKVKADIMNEPGLKSFEINVKTYKGVVQLSGFVDSTESVKKAEEVARNVNGVKEVKNNLLVK